MTSRGYLWDMVQSIADDIALASHLKEQIDKTEDEQERKELRQIRSSVLELRREKMTFLMEEIDMPNPDYWCDVKHALGSWERAVEVDESQDNERTAELAKKSADIFAMCLSKFLGMEFEKCAACLADRLLVQQLSKS